MTIADAPIWAQTPTAEVIREVQTTPHPQDQVRLVMWHHEGESYLSIDSSAPTLTVQQARQVWHRLGELLAIEDTDPADTITKTRPWEVDIDGSRARFKETSLVPCQAATRDGLGIWINVELYDSFDGAGIQDRLNEPDIQVLDEHGHDGLVLRSVDDARDLAFGLFKAAHITEAAIEANL